MRRSPPEETPLEDELRAALAAYREGRKAVALEHLLRAWRTGRAPAIADLIDLASDDVARSLPALAGRTQRARQESWIDRAAGKRAIDLGVLLRGFTSTSCGHLRQRIERLAGWPDDPRVARVLVALAVEPTCTSSSNRPLWTVAFELLRRLDDARGASSLRAALQRRRRADTSFWGAHSKRIARLVAGLPEPAPLSTGEGALATTIEELIRTASAAPPTEPDALVAGLDELADRAPTRDELEALVYAYPAADGPREVLADWLSERDDPRGEFISLQLQEARGALSAAGRKRARALTVTHGREWLGELEPVVERTGLEFRRGFPAVLTARFRTGEQRRRLVGHGAWATVERIATAERDLLVHPCMRSLRAVQELSPELAGELATCARELPFEELRVELAGPEESAALRHLGEARALPRLERLHLLLPRVREWVAGWSPELSPGGFPWLVASRLRRRLRALHVRRPMTNLVDQPSLPTLAEWMELALPFVELDVYDWRFALTRRDDRFTLGLRWCETFTYAENRRERLEQALSALPRARRAEIVEVVLEAPATSREPTFADSLASLLADFPVARSRVTQRRPG